MKYLQHIDYGDKNAPLRALSLHGFPSVRSKQNRELAEVIAGELNCRVRVVLYPGLSADGHFSFKKTINALVAEFPELAKAGNSGQQKVSLLGHSFGGFCALLLASKYPQLISRMVLLSPLLKFNPSVKDVTGFFNNLLESGKEAGLSTLSSEELAEEFYDLSKQYSVENLIASLDPSLHVKLMQARRDNVTPTSVAEDLRRHFKCHFDFELVDQDHSFLIDRPALGKKIAAYL